MSGTSTPTTKYHLLSRSLYVYSLPPELFNILTVRSIQPSPTPVDPSSDPSTSKAATTAPNESAASGAGSSLTCQTCLNVGFTSVGEQRAHFKSDWHRYNAKVAVEGKGKGRGVLTAEEFDELNDGVSSLSGSESDSSTHTADTSPETDRVTKLLKKQTLTKPNGTPNGDGAEPELDSDEEAEQAEYKRRAELRTALLWFNAIKPSPPNPNTQQTLLPPDTQLGIYRSLLPLSPSAPPHPSHFLPALKAVQLPQISALEEGYDPTERKITLLMVAGGHFAGMVIGLKPLEVGQGKGKRGEKQDVKGAGEVRVLRHKTFHRYTTRKKQGGSQALNDNAKSKAVSAGAMLRRYGEQSLKEEIQALLTEWAEDLHTSEKIFLRASTHGKKSFWGYQGAVLDKTDERIRVFPFPTRRPTLAECLRCFHELTRVKISHLTDDALKSLEEAYIASLQPKSKPPLPSSIQPAPKEKEAKPKLSAEEELYRERRERLVEMVKKGRLEALKAFWAKYGETHQGGVNGKMEEWMGGEEGLTILMIASAAGEDEVVRWLLEDVRADPTILQGGSDTAETDAKLGDHVDGEQERTSSAKGRTAYDFATSKSTRNIFRRLAHDHPDWYDWLKAGHVPSGLSEEKEAELEKKKVDRRKGLREKMKEREAKRPAHEMEEPEPEPVKEEVSKVLKGGGQKLGGTKAGAGAEGGLSGLTAEVRARIERERRARAAEARLGGK